MVLHGFCWDCWKILKWDIIRGLGEFHTNEERNCCSSCILASLVLLKRWI